MSCQVLDSSMLEEVYTYVRVSTLEPQLCMRSSTRPRIGTCWIVLFDFDLTLFSTCLLTLSLVWLSAIIPVHFVIGASCFAVGLTSRPTNSLRRSLLRAAARATQFGR